MMVERRKYNYEKLIVLVNKKIPCISYAQKMDWGFFIFIVFSAYNYARTDNDAWR